MKFRSRASLRCLTLLTAVLALSACSDDRKQPLTQVEIIDIPAADVDNQQNTNINNPTLDVPVTYPVADGDLLTLVWSDEFDGAELDPEVWFFETGDGTRIHRVPGGGATTSCSITCPTVPSSSNGALQITARRETAEGYNYTSARIMTRDRFRVQVRAHRSQHQAPVGAGHLAGVLDAVAGR